MKNRELILNCSLILLAAVLLASCATSHPRGLARVEDPLYGTWVNEEIVGSKVVYNPDGKGLVYNRGATEPFEEHRFSIEEKWTDEIGNTYYKVLAKRSSYPYNESKASKWYILHRINAAGDTLESVSSPSEYPTEVSKLGGKYFIRYRQ
jgi:hypothetical protein